MKVDQDVILDGVILVGDFPLPAPLFEDEPEYVGVSDEQWVDRPFSCVPSRNSVLISRQILTRDRAAVLARYRNIQDAALQGKPFIVGLRTPITGDFALAEDIRRKHPLIQTHDIPSSFWISRFTARGNPGSRALWDLRSDTGQKGSYYRVLNKSGVQYWGEKFHFPGGRPETPYRAGRKLFFDLIPAESELPISFDYTVGAVSPVYEAASTFSRIFDYIGASPKKFRAGASMFHSFENKPIPKNLDSLLLIISWNSNSNSQPIMPEDIFNHVAHWWFTSLRGRAVIFPVSPLSHDITGDVFRLLLEKEYHFVGDFYLDLQKLLKRKEPNKAFNNLVLFGNGLAHMPKLDLTTINKGALMSLYPDAFSEALQTSVGSEFNKANIPFQEQEQDALQKLMQRITPIMC